MFPSCKDTTPAKCQYRDSNPGPWTGSPLCSQQHFTDITKRAKYRNRTCACALPKRRATTSTNKACWPRFCHCWCGTRTRASLRIGVEKMMALFRCAASRRDMCYTVCMNRKTCFKCLRDLPASDFYRHPQTADGLLGKCKQCTRADVAQNRQGKRDQYRAYDKLRQQVPNRKLSAALAQSRHRAKYPEKYKARCAVNNALRDGRLTRQPCASCGCLDDLHAHHVDYDKPLAVEWFCGHCHRLLHGIEHP